MSNQNAEVLVGTTTDTYNGFYLRNNLQCTGTIPSPGPYNLSPDIIQSNTVIANASSTLTTVQSWAQMYSTDPTVGQTNYYYVRGINGATSEVQAQVALYYAPAQLIMFPASWQNNQLMTSKGNETVNVTADTGHIDVGDDVYVWADTPAPPAGSDYYGFVAQVNDANDSNPIPVIASWLSMSSLVTQNLGFGFRNTCYVDSTAQSWCHREMLSIPESVGSSGQVMIYITATGFIGDTIAFTADQFLPNQQLISLQPTKISNNGAVMGVTVSLDPGVNTSIAVQYWNTSGNTPAAGSSITLAIYYMVPPGEVDLAASLGLLNSVHDHYLQVEMNITPQPTAFLGSASFVVDSVS